MNHFDTAFEIVVGHEGGYVNDPNDPGGETKYGISKRSYPYVDIANLELEGSKEIYDEDFWRATKCDRMPWPLCLYVFDGAVNQGCITHGPPVTEKLLQKALDVKQDGIIGKKTLAAAAKATDWHCDRFMAYRALRYFGTRNFDRYGVGWLTRTYAISRQGEIA